MEWWTHALYALAIVVVALIGSVAWFNERDNRKVAERDESAASSRAAALELKLNDILSRNRALHNDFREMADSLNDEKATVSELMVRLDHAESRAQSAEQSNRAYKGHNKRYRERIAELETELDACYQDCAQLKTDLEDAENEV